MDTPPADTPSRKDLLRIAVSIVAAYVGKNRLAAAQIPATIGSVHAALAGLQSGPAMRPQKKTGGPKAAGSKRR